MYLTIAVLLIVISRKNSRLIVNFFITIARLGLNRFSKALSSALILDS